MIFWLQTSMGLQGWRLGPISSCLSQASIVHSGVQKFLVANEFLPSIFSLDTSKFLPTESPPEGHFLCLATFWPYSYRSTGQAQPILFSDLLWVHSKLSCHFINLQLFEDKKPLKIGYYSDKFFPSPPVVERAMDMAIEELKKQGHQVSFIRASCCDPAWTSQFWDQNWSQNIP